MWSLLKNLMLFDDLGELSLGSGSSFWQGGGARMFRPDLEDAIERDSISSPGSK